MDQVTATPGAAPAAPASPAITAGDVRSGISQILNAPSDGETQIITSQVGELLEQASQSTAMEQSAAEVLDKVAPETETPPPAPTEEVDDDDEQEPPLPGADPAQTPNQPPGKSARRNAAYGWAKQIASAYHGQDLKVVTPDQLPTVEEFKAMRDAHGALAAIDHEFSQATPEAHEALVQRLNTANPEAMTRLASNMVQVLPRVNPQAYRSLAAPVVKTLVDSFYQRAEAEQDMEAKRSLGVAAQILEHFVTGGRSYRPLSYLEDGGAQGQPQPQSGMTPEMQRILAENQQFRQRAAQSQRQAAEQAASARMGQIDQAVSTEVDGAAKDALAALADSYKGFPKVFEALQEKFRKDVEASIEANPNMQHFVRERDAAARTGDERAYQAAMGRFKSMLNAAVAAHKSAYFRSSRQQMETVQKDRHEQLRQAAEVRHPAPSVNVPGGSPNSIDISRVKSPREGIRALLNG